MADADYRKWNDRQMNSSTYHKKDGTNVRAILKEESNKVVKEGVETHEENKNNGVHT